MFQVRQPAFVLLLLLVGAATLVTASNSATCSHRVSACNSSVDYFPVKLQFAHSGSVKSLQYYNTYVVAQMSWVAWSGTHAVTYVFVRCGCPSPNVGGDSKEFYVPVSSVLIEETVAVPKLYMIGQGQKVVAVASSAFVTTTQLLDDVRAGLVVDIQSNFTRLLTALPALPDVLLTGTGSTSSKRGWTAEMTARQFLDADAGETSPLGRAELVKLTGLLTGAEDAANAVFGLIAYRYDQVKLIGQAAQRRPTVMLGVPFGSFYGVNGWTITKGSSYMGGFLRDAGMLYLNDDDRLDSLGRVDAATMLGLFGSADLWINALYAQPAGVAFTMDALVSGNQTMTPGGDRSVFTQFKAFQCGAVLANSKAIRAPLAGNPFFELGVVRPDLILADLLHYAHPELRPQLIGSDGSAYVPHFYERPAPLTNSAGVPPCPDVAVPDVPPAGSAMFTQLLSVSGPTVFALQPLLPAVARAMSDATGVPRGSLGLSIANATAPWRGGFNRWPLWRRRRWLKTAPQPSCGRENH
jgi:iron complex transport system substrate-binding protein